MGGLDIGQPLIGQYFRDAFMALGLVIARIVPVKGIQQRPFILLVVRQFRLMTGADWQKAKTEPHEPYLAEGSAEREERHYHGAAKHQQRILWHAGCEQPQSGTD